MKFGKAPARLNAIEFKFKAYLDITKLPTPPAVFGHQTMVTAPWGMLGNDTYGDCVWAGAAHEEILWNAEGDTSVTFTTDNVLSDYTAVTGFDPQNPDSDQGTDMELAAQYRRKTGIIDAAGKRHQVDSYVDIERGNLDQLLVSGYLFGACGLGIQVPRTAMAQFQNNQVIDVVDKKSPIIGGHYIPFVGRNAAGNLLIVSYGRIYEMTPAFFLQYNDEGITYISLEPFVDGKSPEGFNIDSLRQDLAAL